jgi:large subunit ribosomal protein L25
LAGQVALQVASRSVLGKQVKQLRRQGIIPANIYGRHQPSQPLQLDHHTLERFLAGHNATRIIDLQVGGSGGTRLNALVRHISRSPRTGKIMHVDFLQVAMNEPITVRVPLALKGTAPAVTVEGGVLLHMLDTIEVECLPGDLPEALELDISSLAQIDETRYVRDVPMPAGVKLMSEPDEPVVKVVAPRAVLAEVAEEAAEAASAPSETPAAEATESES